MLSLNTFTDQSAPDHERDMDMQWYRKRYGLIDIVILSLSIASMGCSRPALDRPFDTASVTGTIRVACVGNSITYGHGIEDRANDSYPARLDAMLSERWEVRNFGVSGATMLKRGNKPYWEESAYQDALAFEPHIVVIKLGTNDTKPQNWVYSVDFDDDLLAMIGQFRELPSAPRIWICLPVPAYGVRWDIRGDVIEEEVMPMILDIADEAGVPVIDLFEPLSGKPALFPDLIHPNEEGAELIASEVYHALTGN